jgi:galactokinase
MKKRRLFATAHLAMTSQLKPQSSQIYRWFIPGRLEFMGKHTDYCRGRSILGAIDRGFCFCVAPRWDSRLRILDAENGLKAEMDLSAASLASDHTDWTVYPATVARRLSGMSTVPIRGADVTFISDLPPAAGLSSSSCLIVGFYLALARSNSETFAAEDITLPQTPVTLGEFLGCVESGQPWREHSGDKGVGTHGGSQDHTAILCSKAGELTEFDFYDSCAIGSVALPDHLTFAIAVSGISAHKTGSAGAAYNQVSRRARTCVQLWNNHSHHHEESLEALFRSEPETLQDVRQAIMEQQSMEFASDLLVSRLEQYHAESHELIPAAMAAMRHGNWMELGRIVDKSQHLAETCLLNQVPQTQYLASSARQLGAVAASAFGAGFGGAVWALVKRTQADLFIQHWREAYLAEFPKQSQNASFFETSLGLPATELPAITSLEA